MTNHDLFNTIANDVAVIQPVDPNYQSWFSIVRLLVKLKVIDIQFKVHSISYASMLIGGLSQHKIPGHWIPLALVSLSQEYIEVVPVRRGHGSEVL